MNSDSFINFTDAAQAIADSRGFNAKSTIFCNYLSTIPDMSSQLLALRYFSSGAFSSQKSKRVLIGQRTIAITAAEFLELDYELVFKACKTATGSISEAIEKLMEYWPMGIKKRKPSHVTLAEVDEWFQEMTLLKKKKEKPDYLKSCWEKLHSQEIKYFNRIILQRGLQIGFDNHSILKSLSHLFGISYHEIPLAHMLSRSMEDLFIRIKNERLSDITFSFSNPLEYMFALPFQDNSIFEFNDFIAEEKLDGMRCQMHIQNNRIVLYSRDKNNITHQFPDIIQKHYYNTLNNFVIDGVICVYRNETIRSFLELQKRLDTKIPTESLISAYPVEFIAFDVLYHSNQLLLNRPWFERRKILEKLHQDSGLPITIYHNLTTSDTIEHLYTRAREHGNIGLVLKKKDGEYEFGRRGHNWLTVKKPIGNMKVVILYAHAKNGQQSGFYSDFTMGIRVDTDSRYKELFIPIGKSNRGYDDEELKKINSLIKPLINERFGPTVMLEPKIIVEIEFDAIHKNNRTKARYSLYNSKFKAIRQDLEPKNADTLVDVEEFYKRLTEFNRRPNSEQPAFYI